MVAEAGYIDMHSRYIDVKRSACDDQVDFAFETPSDCDEHLLQTSPVQTVPLFLRVLWCGVLLDFL